MPRKLYESKQDLSKENELAKQISYRWACSLRKLPIHYHLDFAAEREGKIVAFMEFKCRTSEMNKYPTYMISMSKMMTARSMYGVSGKESFLIVQWKDKIAKCEMLWCKYEVGMGGRTDRGDWQDVDPCCYIPLSEFTVIADTGSSV